MSDERFVIVDQAILDGQPIRAISYLEPIADWDSGFCLFAGEPGDDTDTALVCLHCLIDEHPELGRELDIAREHGEAIRDRSEWITLGLTNHRSGASDGCAPAVGRCWGSQPSRPAPVSAA